MCQKKQERLRQMSIGCKRLFFSILAGLMILFAVSGGSVLTATANATLTTASDIYVVNFNTKDSRTNTSYTEVSTGDSGYLNGQYTGEGAYLGTYNGKVRFLVAGVIGEVSASDVTLIPLSECLSLNQYYVSDGNLMHKITIDVTKSSYLSYFNNGVAPSYLKANVTYYSYDGHYFYTDYATMLSDYKNNVRSNSVNPSNPFYNYYQYLSLRSTTSYTGSQLSKYVNNYTLTSSKLYNKGDVFVQDQNTYGINALIAFSIAINESGWGNSPIAQNKNNLFGLNAVDATPSESANYYADVETCVKDFMSTYMDKKYMYPNSSVYAGGYLGNKASGINVMYGSDPYWGEKIASIAYRLDTYLGGTDYKRYTIGAINSVAISGKMTALNVRNGSSTSSKVLYAAPGRAAEAFLVLNSTAENKFYKIQSDPELTADRSQISKSGTYDRTVSYAYASANYIQIVINGSSNGENTLVKNADGTYTLYKDGQVYSSYTGFYRQNDDIWYVKNGVVNTTETENIVQDSAAAIGTKGQWWYIKGGKVTYDTTVAKNAYGWWYVKNGVVDFSYTGIAKNAYGWWRIVNGKVDFTCNSVEQNEYGWWYLKGGKVDFSYTGIAQNKNGWWRIVNGKVDFTCNSIEQNENGWWYLTNGKVDFNYTGFAKNANGWWYVTKGRVTFKDNSVIQGTVNNSKAWWYVKGSKVQFVNTIAQNAYGWWRIVNGKVDFTCNSVEQNEYGWWRIVNGKVDFTCNSIEQNANGWWYLKDGKVDFSYTGFGSNANGWWYVVNGKVDFKQSGFYQGTVNDEDGQWYVKDGKVQLDYNGVYEQDNVTYTIENGKVVESLTLAE